MIAPRDGIAINLEGRGRGRHVTLIHAVGSHLQAWDGIVGALRDECTLLRHDLRGHAKSGKPAGPYALDDYITDLTTLLDAQSVSPTTLVGFSFGGMIVPALAVRHPERAHSVSSAPWQARTARGVLMRDDEVARGGRPSPWSPRSSDGSPRNSGPGIPGSSSDR